MFEVCVWSGTKQATESLSKSLIDKKIPVVDDIDFGCSSAEAFKLSTILKNYSVKRSDALVNEALLAGHSVKAKDMRVRLAFSDTTQGSVDALENAAAVAKTNPISTEQFVFVTTDTHAGANVVKVTGYSQHVVLEKIARPESIIDKSAEKYASVCQIHATPVKSFISAAMALLSNSAVTIKYLDAMTDPDTNTGIAAIALTSTMVFSEDDDGDTVSGGSIVPSVIVGFFAAKFNMNENPLKRMLPQPSIITAMNRGLKNKIKLLSRMGSETRLSCKMTEDIMAGELLSVDICATDKDGNLLTSTISSSKVNDAALIAAFKDRDILLDSVMLETALNACKGDLKIGLSLKKISLISDDAIVHAATKISAAPAIPAQAAAVSEATPAPQITIDPIIDRSESLATLANGGEISMEDAITDGLVSTNSDDDPDLDVATIAAEALFDVESTVRKDTVDKLEADEITERHISSAETPQAIIEEQPIGKAAIITENGYTVVTVSRFEQLGNMYVFKDLEAKLTIKVPVPERRPVTVEEELMLQNKKVEYIDENDIFGVIGEAKFVIKPEAAGVMPVRQPIPRAVIKIKGGTLRHKILIVLEQNKDSALNNVAILEMGVGIIPPETTHASLNAALSLLAREGLLIRPSRGRFQIDPAAKYELVE